MLLCYLNYTREKSENLLTWYLCVLEIFNITEGE